MKRSQHGSTAAMVILAIGVAGVFGLAIFGIFQSSGQSQDILAFDRDLDHTWQTVSSAPSAEGAQVAWPTKNANGEARTPWGMIEFIDTEGGVAIGFDVPRTACADLAARLSRRSSYLAVLNEKGGNSIILKNDADPSARFSLEKAGSACLGASPKRIEARLKSP